MNDDDGDDDHDIFWDGTGRELFGKGVMQWSVYMKYKTNRTSIKIQMTLMGEHYPNQNMSS